MLVVLVEINLLTICRRQLAVKDKGLWHFFCWMIAVLRGHSSFNALLSPFNYPISLLQFLGLGSKSLLRLITRFLILGHFYGIFGQRRDMGCFTVRFAILLIITSSAGSSTLLKWAQCATSETFLRRRASHNLKAEAILRLVMVHHHISHVSITLEHVEFV